MAKDTEKNKITRTGGANAIVPVEGGASITFRLPPKDDGSFGPEVLRFDPDGSVFVRGEKVDTNHEAYKAMLEWLALAYGMMGRNVNDDANCRRDREIFAGALREIAAQGDAVGLKAREALESGSAAVLADHARPASFLDFARRAPDPGTSVMASSLPMPATHNAPPEPEPNAPASVVTHPAIPELYCEAHPPGSPGDDHMRSAIRLRGEPRSAWPDGTRFTLFGGTYGEADEHGGRRAQGGILASAALPGTAPAMWPSQFQSPHAFDLLCGKCGAAIRSRPDVRVPQKNEQTRDVTPSVLETKHVVEGMVTLEAESGEDWAVVYHTVDAGERRAGLEHLLERLYDASRERKRASSLAFFSGPRVRVTVEVIGEGKVTR